MKTARHNENEIAIYLALYIKEMNYKYHLQLLDYNNNFDFWVYEPLNMLLFDQFWPRFGIEKKKVLEK